MSAANAAAQAAFRTTPHGFFHANELLNTFSANAFTQIVLDLLQSLSTQSALSPAKYVESTGVTLPQVSSGVNCLSFIFRLFISHAVTPEQASPLLAKETELSEEKREIVVRVWGEKSNGAGSLLSATAGESKVSTVARTLSLGRLVRFNWRVGVGISSNNCDNLAAPFVTLSFEIAQSGSGAADNSTDSSTRTYLVECTHHQFQDVRKHFQDIFLQLDAI